MAVIPTSVPTAVGFQALPLQFPILPSAARTTTPDTVEFRTEGAEGLIVAVAATAATDTPAVTVTVYGVLPDDTTYEIGATAAITGTGVTVLMIHPALTAVSNAKISALIPDRIRVTAAHGDADSLTYSIYGVLTP